MKWFIASSVVQIALLTALLVLSSRSNPDTGVKSSDAASVASARAESTPTATGVVTLDEEKLRRIIREEMAANSTHAPDRLAKSPAPLDQTTLLERQQKRDRVAQHIETYKGVGTISDRQMDELQSEIEQLEEPNRGQMLSMLIRALNSGAIKGQLQ